MVIAKAEYWDKTESIITDKDGCITAKDARFVLRCSVGLEEYTDEALKAMDMNSDNSVTASDARCILRIFVGLPM